MTCVGVTDFFAGGGDAYEWVILSFVFVAAIIYANGGSFSGSLFFGGIGLLTYIPITIAATLSGAVMGGALFPLFALAIIAYLIVLGKWLGPVSVLAMCGCLALILGA